MYNYKPNASVLARALALLLSLVLICDLSFGTLGVEAKDIGAYAQEAHDENSPESVEEDETPPVPDDADDNDPEPSDETGTPGDSDETGTPGDSDETGTPGDSEETGTPGDSGEAGTPGESEEDKEAEPSVEDEDDESPEEAEQDEPQEFELSDNFGQFVKSAVLLGENGTELINAPVLSPDSSVTLRLGIDIEARALEAILNAGDEAEFEVHIPNGLTVKDASYGIRSGGKLLGELNVEDGHALFVFNTVEEKFFGGELKDLKDLALNIPCSFDAEAIGGAAEFILDLSEYDGGAAYVISFESPEPPVELPPIGIMPVDLPLPLDPIGTFTQFIKNAILVKSGGLTTEMPDDFPLDKGEEIFMRFDLHDLSGTELISIMSAPGPYAIEIPELLKGVAITPAKGIYIQGSSEPLGFLNIDSSGNASFTFNIDNDEIFDGETAIIRNLWMDFKCVLNEAKINANDRTVTVDMKPYSDKEYKVSIPSNMPKGERSMFKTGSKNADGRYDWKITVNTLESTEPQDMIYGPFTDNTGEYHALFGTIAITGSQYDPENPLANSTTGLVTYTAQNPLIIDPSDLSSLPAGFGFEWVSSGGFKITFDKPFTGPGAANISYTTKLTDAAFASPSTTVNLQNDAEMQYDENYPDKKLTASYPLKGEKSNFMAKDGKFNYALKEIEWTITVDTLGQSYDYLYLFDKMATTALTIEKGSVKVNGVSPAQNPIWLLTESDTTGDPNGTIMRLAIWENGANLYPGKTELTITYITKIPEGYIDYNKPSDAKVDNGAWLTYNWIRGIGDGTGGSTVVNMPPTLGKGAPESVPVLKEALSYNPSTRLITWKITLNSNCIDLENIELTDILNTTPPNGSHINLKYATGSLTVGGEKITGQDEADFAARVNSGSAFYFGWSLNNVTASFLVTTEVNDDSFLYSNAKKDFYNTISMTANRIGSPSRTVTGSDSDSITPANNVLKKSGKYDYSTHAMTWTILVNADKINDFPNAVITDEIESVQTLVDNSINISGGNAGTNVINGNPTDNPSGTVYKNGNTLTFNLGDLGGNPGKMVTITYKTKHNNLNDAKERLLKFNNSATLTVGEAGATTSVTAPSPTIDIPLIVLQKSVKGVNKPDPSVAVITYQVLINQHNIGYSATVGLTDTVAVNSSNYGVDVDPSSVELYNASINSTGTFNKGARIATSATLKPGFSGTTFILTLPALTQSAILEYDVIVWDKAGQPLSGTIDNNIVATGDDIGGVNSGVSGTNLGSASGAGGSLEKYLKVQITKEDEKPNAYTKKLTGVEFGLFLKKTGDTAYTTVATTKTGSDGKANFNLLMPSYANDGDYFIKEVTPATGYNLPTDFSADPYNSDGYIPVASCGKSDDGKLYSKTLENERKEYDIAFNKVTLDASGTAVALATSGVVFTLTKDLEDTTFSPVTVTSNSAGLVTFTGLKWGTYILTETAWPAGYVPHTGTYKLTIDKTTGAFTLVKNPDDSTGTYPKGGGISSFDSKDAIVNEKGSIKITKIDSETGATITPTFGGENFTEAHFALLVKTGTGDFATVASPVASTTDAGGGNFPTLNGELTFYELDYNKTYKVVETSVPTGYDDDDMWESEPPFTIGTTAETIHYTRDAENSRKSVHGFSFTKEIQLYDNGAKDGTATFDATYSSTANKSEFQLERLNEGTDTWEYIKDAPDATKTFTSNDDGVVTFDGLSFGQYRVYETKAPAGYALLKDPIPVVIARSGDGSSTVKIGSGATDITGISTYPIVNEKGSFTITKFDNLYPGTNKNVFQGIVFEVTNNTSSLAEYANEASFTATIGATGAVTVEGLTLGVTYTFTELNTVDGYATSSNTLTFTPQANGTKGSATVDGSGNFYNNRATPVTNSFSFTKVGENTVSGETPVPLNGVGFTLKFATPPTGTQATTLPPPWVYSAGEAYQIATSGSVGNVGTVAFTNLPFGSYVVTENEPGSSFHYRKNKNTISFSIEEDGTVVVSNDPAVSGLDADGGNTKIPYTFTNSLGSVTITKIDAVNNATIATTGISFNLYDMDTSTSTPVTASPYTTGSDGTVKITGLFLNKNYQLREVGAPTGYVGGADDTAKYVDFNLTDEDTLAANLQAGADQKWEYKNARKPLYSFGFIKENFHDEKLPDATFGLFKNAAATEHISGFDSNGAPEIGTAANQIKSTSATVTGEVWFGKGTGVAALPFGTYYVKETSAPQGGFTMSDAVLQVVIKPDGKYTIAVVTDTDPNNTVVFGDVPNATDVASGDISSVIVKNEQFGSIKIIKVDSENNDAKITSSSATFNIYATDPSTHPGAPPVDTAHFTGTSGEVTFTRLDLDKTYYIKETSAPTGYKLSDEVFSFELPINGEGDPDIYHVIRNFSNERATMYPFEFIKTDHEGTALDGATFELFSNSGATTQLSPRAIATSGTTDGKVKFENLKFGTYYIKEIGAPDGYTINPAILKVVISADGTYVLTNNSSGSAVSTLANTRSKTYSFGFNKKDDTTDGNAVGGAVFGLFIDAAAEVPITGFDTNGLPATTGSTANQIKATSTSAGAVTFPNLSFGEYYVQEISAPPNYVKSDAILKVKIEENGKYTVTVVGGPDPTVDLGTSDTDIASGTMSSVIVKNKLLGSLTIIKKDGFNNSLMPNIEFVLYQSATPTIPIATKSTTSSGADIGKVTFNDLDLDTEYTVTETTPTGYVALSSPITATPAYSSNSETYHVVTTVTNTRIATYALTFLKHDPFEQPLENAVFAIAWVPDGTAYSPSLTPDATAASTSNGTVLFENLTFGQHLIWETESPAGYDLSDAVLRATIPADGSPVTFEKAGGNGSVSISPTGTTVINARSSYSIIFDKLASNGAKALKGAVFSIEPTVDSSGNTVVLPSGTATSATSDVDGKVTFTGLPFGAYLIKEESAPKNYTKCAGSFKAEIAIDGTVTFSPDVEDANITFASGGSSVTVTNKYKSSSSSSRDSGGGGGGWNRRSGGGGGSQSPTPVTTPNPQNGLTPGDLPPGSTVTDPEIVAETPDYTIISQQVTSPDNETDSSSITNVITITVHNKDGAVVGDVPPPPPPDDGLIFSGWYLDPEMTIPYRPGDKLPEGTYRLYAKWESAEDYYNNHNPSTGDRFPFKAVSAVSLLALVCILLSRPRSQSV